MEYPYLIQNAILFFCLLLSLDILPLIVSFTIYHANIVVNTFTILNYQNYIYLNIWNTIVLLRLVGDEVC